MSSTAWAKRPKTLSDTVRHFRFTQRPHWRTPNIPGGVLWKNLLWPFALLDLSGPTRCWSRMLKLRCEALLKSPVDPDNSFQELSEVSTKGHWKRGICIRFSEIDFRTCNKSVMMYDMTYQQFCADFVDNLRQLCAMPPLATPPSQNLWILLQ